MKKTDLKSDGDLIEFVRQTTAAITIISETTRQQAETLGGIKELISAQTGTDAATSKDLSGKMDGLLTMFKYVIAPLIAGILGLVGIKFFFTQ
jgi:hypothetical protein